MCLSVDLPFGVYYCGVVLLVFLVVHFYRGCGFGVAR